MIFELCSPYIEALEWKLVYFLRHRMKGVVGYIQEEEGFHGENVLSKSLNTTMRDIELSQLRAISNAPGNGTQVVMADVNFSKCG